MSVCCLFEGMPQKKKYFLQILLPAPGWWLFATAAGGLRGRSSARLRSPSCMPTSVRLWAPAYSFRFYLVFFQFGFVPKNMALMSDDDSAGCVLLKVLSAARVLKLIAQPEMESRYHEVRERNIINCLHYHH